MEEALLAAGLLHGWQTGVAAYEAVGAMAELNLAAGRCVVVDAVNDSDPARGTWRRAAASAGAAVRWVVLTMSDTAGHAARVAGRARGFAHVPEPTWADVVDRTVEPWTDPHRTIDVAGSSAADVAAEVERYAVRSCSDV